MANQAQIPEPSLDDKRRAAALVSMGVVPLAYEYRLATEFASVRREAACSGQKGGDVDDHYWLAFKALDKAEHLMLTDPAPSTRRPDVLENIKNAMAHLRVLVADAYSAGAQKPEKAEIEPVRVQLQLLKAAARAQGFLMVVRDHAEFNREGAAAVVENLEKALSAFLTEPNRPAFSDLGAAQSSSEEV